ncbi:MAG TPA: polymer-forming cytoskeletal protein [Myxococcota bacterium]
MRAEAPDVTGTVAPEPVLQAGMEFCGLLVLRGAARIDGRIRGEVISGGALWIGETGVVEADLEGDSVVVAGRVEGRITASERIELRPTAKVRGSLEAPYLLLAEGSQADGPCRCGETPSQPPRAAKTTPDSA